MTTTGMCCLTERANTDIWSASPCNWICITTNGMLNYKGEAIMGAGIAKQAKEKVKGCARQLGLKIKQGGNHVYKFATLSAAADEKLSNARTLISFPTKHDWRNNSCLKLIEQSCRELLSLWEMETSRSSTPILVSLPKVGCQNGKLDFDTQVRPLLQKYFGNEQTRPYFTVCV